MNKPKNTRGIGAVRYVSNRRKRVLRSRGEDVRPFGKFWVWFPRSPFDATRS